VASGRMRFAMGLTVVGAALLITGLLMVFVSEALRLKSGHSGPGIVRAGELVAFCGLGIGVALLVVLTVGRGDRGRAGRRGRGRRGRAGGARTGDRSDPAEEWRSDPAEEWLSPLRNAGAGLVPQRVMPSWPEPVEEDRTGSGDYADDGWHPDMDDADDGWHPDMDDRWSPGPAHAWSPREEDDWDRGGDGDWGPGGGEDWNPAGPAGISAWPSDNLRRPDGNGQEASPATGPRHGYVTGPHGYLNAPEPGHASGPQPAYRARPEPEQVSDPYLAGPEPGYVSGPEPRYLAGPEPGYVSGPEPRYLAGPEPGYVSGPEPRYLAGPEPGYLAAGPAPGHAAAPRFAGEAGKAYPEAPSSDAPEFGRAREGDATAPIPVTRGPSQPVPEPREREPVAAPEPFSVWEPAPKPSQERRRDSPSNEGYRPAHAEPPSAHTQEKIEQIKDLYLTAEAIGEDALGRHFDQLRERQRSLIREFFEKAGLESKGTPTSLGDDSAQDGASLPG
jgi:hypothetical protein